MSVYVRQSKLTTLESIRQLLVVDAEQVKNRGMEIMDVNPVLSDVVTEVVSDSITHPGLNAAPCHPDAETIWMVVAAG